MQDPDQDLIDENGYEGPHALQTKISIRARCEDLIDGNVY